MALYSKPGIDDKHVKAFLAAGAPPGIVDATFGPGTYARVSGVDPYVGSGPVQTQTSTLPQTISNKPLYSKTGTDDKHVKAFLAAGATPNIVDATFGPGTYARVGQPPQKPVSSPQMSDVDQQKLAEAMLKPYTDDTGNVDISRAMAEGVNAQVIERAWDTETALSFGVMNKFYDKETGNYDVEAAEKAGVSEKIIEAVIGVEGYKEYKLNQTVSKTADRARAIFESSHAKNPADNKWYAKDDLTQYLSKSGIDWDKFNTDLQRSYLHQAINDVGLENAIKIWESNPNLTSFQRQALIEEKKFISKHDKDPVTGEWYRKGWEKDLIIGSKIDPLTGETITTGVFKNKAEVRSLFDTGGMTAVMAGADAAIAAKTDVFTKEYAKGEVDKYKYEKAFRGPNMNADHGLHKITLLKAAIVDANPDFEGDSFWVLNRNVYTSAGSKDYADQRFQEIKDAVIAKYGEDAVVFKDAVKAPFYDKAWEFLNADERAYLTDFYRSKETSRNRRREASLDIVPILGTARTIDRHGFKSGWSIVSAVGDATIFLPLVRGVSVGIKSGESFGKVMTNEMAAVARGELMGPAEILANPGQALSAITAPFASFKPFSKTLPMASFWRGTYSKMSISKVPAGTEPMKVRQAVEEAERQMIAGKKAGSVDIEGGGKIHYSSAGVQQDLPGTVLTATPYGRAFMDQGLVAQGEGLFVGPSAYRGLERSTATGKSVMYGFKGDEFLGIIEDGKLLNDHRRVIGRVKGQAEQGAEIVDNQGRVIGKAKGQPAWVMIQTNGMQVLPEWAEGITSMKQLEKTAWKNFKAGKHGDDLYPVFKQYRDWIEQEGLLPKDTHLIPVLDKKGNQVMMNVRDIDGSTIQIPMMQLVDKNWLDTARKITRDVSPALDLMKPKMSVEKMFAAVTDIPKPTVFKMKGLKITRPQAKVGKVITGWFRKNDDARLVGSAVEYLHTGKHVPHDIDMGARNPIKAAHSLAKEVEEATGVNVNVIENSDKTARLEWVNDDGINIEMANVKFADDTYKTVKVDGVRMEAPSAQLERALKRMESDFSGKGYARWERYLKSAGQKADIGIGAKPPSLLDIEKMRVKGWKNTVSDIFNRELKLEKRVAAADEVSDNLADEVNSLAKKEAGLDDLQSQSRQIETDIQNTQDKLVQAKRQLDEFTAQEKSQAQRSEAARRKATKAKTEADQKVLANEEKELAEDLGKVRRQRDLAADKSTEYTVALNRLKDKARAINQQREGSRVAIERQQDEIRNDIRRYQYYEKELMRALRQYDETVRRDIRPRKTVPLTPRSGRVTDREVPDRETVDRVTPPVPPDRTPPPVPPPPDRQGRDEPPREPTDIRRPPREPEDPDKPKLPHPSNAEITELKGVPDKPGEVLWGQGIVWIEAQPPSPDSIKKGQRGQVRVLKKPPPDAPVKTGTPSETLFTRGKAPEIMKVKVGNQVATVKRGKTIKFDRSPIYLTRSGRKIITHREGSLIRRKY